MFSENNGQLFILSVTFVSQSRVHTCRKGAMWLLVSFEKVTVPSRYTSTEYHPTNENKKFVALWIVSGAFSTELVFVRTGWVIGDLWTVSLIYCVRQLQSVSIQKFYLILRWFWLQGNRYSRLSLAANMNHWFSPRCVFDSLRGILMNHLSKARRHLIWPILY